MSHGVAYFIWRKGRPRWQPGATLRARGFRGQDLKDDGGNWMGLEAALDAARKINDDIPGRARFKPPRLYKEPRYPNVIGYVYFLRIDNHIKLGFSLKPLTRIGDIAGNHFAEVSAAVIIAGNQADEKKLHRQFRRDRVAGEWFFATAPLLEFMCASARFGRLAFRETVNK